MMHTISNTSEIDAPLSTVWAVLSDLASFPDWNPVIQRAEGRLIVGDTVRIFVGPRGETTWTCSVVRLDHGREFAWRFHERHPLLYKGEHSFRLEAIDAHRTRLIDREDFSGLLVPLRRRALNTNINGSMNAMAAALKQRTETDTGT